MIVDTDEEAGEDIQDEVWEGPKSRSFCFYGVRETHTFPVYGCIHQHERALRSPCYWHFTDACLYRRDQLLTPISNPSTLTKVRVEAGLKNSKLLIMAGLLVPAPNQEPTQVAPLKRKMLLTIKKPQGFQQLSQELASETMNMFYFSHTHHSTYHKVVSSPNMCLSLSLLKRL